MGTSTYELSGGPMRFKSGELDRNSAAPMAAALAESADLHGMNEPNADSLDGGMFPPIVAEQLACFGLDADFQMLSDRPPYDTTTGEDGQILAARAIAPWIMSGSWQMYETEGSVWAIVWDGTTAHVCDCAPIPPAGVTLL